MKRNMTLSLAKLGQAINQRRGARLVALSFILTSLVAAGLIAGLRGSHAQSGGGAPDYSQVDDFTNGATHLLRNDDLVMTFSYSSASGQPRGSLFTAGTTASQPAFLIDRQIIPQGPGCHISVGCQYDYPQFVGNKPATGRFFNTTSDTTVHYPVLLDGYPYFVSLAGKTTTTPPSTGLKWTTAQSINFVTGGDSFLAGVGDFNQDGYDDLLMGWSNTSAFPSNPKLCVATAVDVNDSSQGFKFGPVFATSDQAGIRELAVGDFNGDRQPDIAYLSVDNYQGAQLNLFTFTADPATLTISRGGFVQLYTLASVAVTTALTMTPGKFTSAINQQLAVGFHVGNGQNLEVQIVDFNPGSVQPKLMTTLDVPDNTTDPVFKLKAGRFNWASPYDQIAWMSSTFQYGTRLEILTVDPVSLKVTKKSDYLVNAWDTGNSASNNVYQGLDIAIGNFDRMDPSASDPTQKERSPNLQIAVIGKLWRRVQIFQNPPQYSFTGGGLLICNVSEDFSSITENNHTDTPKDAFFGGNEPYDLSIAAGDLQGRSFRLGSGYKVTVDQTMPTVVLAVPPMHADYVSPGIGQAPTVLNLSVVPDAFKSVYEESGSTTSSVTDTETTSSSFAGEESYSQKVEAGEFNPSGNLTEGVRIQDTFTAKQDIKNSNDTINGAFNSSEYEISQNTGLSDVVWFKDSSYYLYVYPVIGRKVCPSSKADKNGNCADSDLVPMLLMFSAPKEATVQHLASDTLEWYQPPWEYGNLLSYPAGLPQLRQYIPNISLLTQEVSTFATDDASATLKTTWSNGRTTGTNVESEKLFTEENDLSVEGEYEVTPFGFGGAGSSKLDLNFGGSNGTKSLSESSTQFNSARGITVSKTASFPNPLAYKYFFSPYIFGKIKPVGYTDPVPTDPSLLLAYGTLRSAFTVDPIGSTGTGGGGWWSQSPYKQFPDVAVNHPNRWAYGAQAKPSNGVIPSNCVGLENLTSMNCVTPTERATNNPWLDPFHDMRGFFITDAANSPDPNPFVAGGGGAQLETTTAGNKLTLSTRVYNYSFKAMPAGSQVKVRFYGMLWDTTNNFPADAKLQFNADGSITILDPGGASFQIGDDVRRDPIAPFSNDPKAPLNWVLASTTFDTTPYENKALVFWVAVWMEDANGNLVQELASHGLTGIPTSTATPTFTAVTALEQLVANPLGTDPAQVSFSNNIGFYKSAFHILPKTTATAVPAPVGATSVGVESVKVSGAAVKPGQSAAATVTLRGGAQELTGLTVYFYDGDPAAGGRLVDAERVAHLRAGSRQAVNILFRPQACGSHQLFVRVVKSENVIATGRAAQAVQLDCPTPVCVAQVCMRSAQYYALNLNNLPHGMVTTIGGGLNNQVSTSDTKRLSLILQGGVSRQLQLNRQLVATQLSLLAQAGLGQTALQSNLLCYKLNFQPVELSNGQTLSPAMTLGELFAQVRQAGQAGDAIDQRQLTNLLQLLNGDDPLGRCQ